MKTKFLALLTILPGLLPVLLRAGELRVADVYTDRAVLQQGVDVPVWGTATAGDTVTVQFAGQTKRAQAANDGSWQVELAPLNVSSTGDRMIVETGRQRKEFHDLLVGEVWYASGQSNMQMTLGGCARKLPAIREFIETHERGIIRVLRIDEPDSPEPLSQRQRATGWQSDTAANRARQSAVAYFFARRLQTELDVSPTGSTKPQSLIWSGNSYSTAI